MKKLLIMLLVMSMAPLANALVVLDFNGAPNPGEITVHLGDHYWLSMYDTTGGVQWAAYIVLSGPASFTGNLVHGPAAIPGAFAYTAYGYFALGYNMVPNTSVPGVGMAFDFEVNCTGPGDVWVTLIDFALGPTDSMLIHQVLPICQVTPVLQDFGSVDVGYSTGAQLFNIQNIGTGTLSGNASLVGGVDFVLAGDPVVYNLTNDSVGIDVSVTFEPQSLGAKADTLVCTGGAFCESDITGIGTTCSSPDTDADTIPDSCDNCPNMANPDQTDCNQDGVGDLCQFAADPNLDCNGNGVLDECELYPPPPDAADDCFDALFVCPFVTYTGTTVGATNDGSASCATSSSTPDVWYLYRPMGDGTLTVSLCGSLYDTGLTIHSGCPGTVGNELACNDDFCGPCDSLQSQVSLAVTAGTDYLIRIAGYDGSTGQYTMMLTGPPCSSRPDCDGVCDGDCDANGIPDECDIANGTRGDLNLNGIPDECEFDFDGDLDIDINDFAAFASYWQQYFGP